ncbi:hypothetical protein HZB58_00080 [Candidatus Gottesmanbacteria bacterium]|nr:hypothetical protein [Candidatus Gottesmanbacteria bacterium]
MRKLFIFLAILLLLPVPVFAKYDPLAVPNNKYGIHIVDPNGLGDAAKLVNSGGGDWGYVTLVIQEDDRDLGKWQRVLNDMRSLHLIPIVRIATHINGDSWAKPYNDSASDWARFLNSLNWPTENRYVSIFNEPNHANEWGKSLDPEDYARTLVRHAQKLHEASEDFFVLPAGLDVSAASDGRSLDASVFLSRMFQAEPKLADHLDGWASHSYPNPAFSGSPYATGRGTLRSYQWELNRLKELGVTKKLPVFITETGWVHSEGVVVNSGLLSSAAVGANLTIAATSVWTDPDIVAVTPFVLSYQGLPFDHFSWKKLGSEDFYSQYQTYQQIPKQKGQPRQREKYTLDHKIIPETLVAGSTYVLEALLKNEGQGILTEQNKEYTLTFTSDAKMLMVYNPLPVMEPHQFGTLTVHLETPNAPGTHAYALNLLHNGNTITVEAGTLTLVPPPSVTVRLNLGWRNDSSASNATVLVYDNLALIHKIQGVTFKNGTATVGELRNVVPGNKYRIVTLVPYYLPTQSISVLKPDTTIIDMPKALPLDFDRDGALSFGDILAVVKLQPNFIMSLFVAP